MDEYRVQFPIVERYAYLDHAAAGPVSGRVLAAQRTFLEGWATRGSELSGQLRESRERLRGAMAGFIGAGADEIAFTKNTPEGLCFVAAGLPWRAGDSVVTSDLEFPANMYPWLSLREQGVEVRIVRSQSGRLPPESLLAAIDGTTRVLALSYVQFSTGFRADLARLAEACRPRGILLVIDAMQAVGALPIDVHSLGIDFLACASHKWLLAPFGMGWFYCRRELLERLRPTEVGVDSVRPRSSYLDYQLDLLPSAARYECGQINMGGVAGLQAAIDLLSEIGPRRVWELIEALTSRLTDGLAQRGYQVVSSRADGERSGIVSFRHARYDSAALRERLHQAGVIVSLREGLVRVSPHFYNSADEADRLLEALPPAL